ARHMYRSWAEKVHLEKIYDTRSVVSSFTSGQLRKMREAIEARETESPIVLGENERTLSAHLRSLVWPFEGDSYAFHSAPDSALLTGSRNSFRSWRRESLDQPTRRRRTS